MSEEEKKAINFIKEVIELWLDKDKSYVFGTDYEKENLKIILNLIDRLKKEIEKLKFNNHMVGKWNEYLDKECVSKDKIREIRDYITSLEYFNNNNKGNINDYFVSHNKILKMIDELLGE